MKKFWLVPGCLLLVAASCAAFPYKYYGIDPSASKLLGPSPRDDLPLANCQGVDGQKGKCAVLFIEEFERLMIDYTEIKNQLKACEENR
jgi:hypothetical protein